MNSLCDFMILEFCREDRQDIRGNETILTDRIWSEQLEGDPRWTRKQQNIK